VRHYPPVDPYLLMATEVTRAVSGVPSPPLEQVTADSDDLQQCTGGTPAPLGELVDAPGSRDERAGAHQ
jgi:hypothetical protein